MLASLEPIIQKDIADCAIAALAMALGRSYREVSEIAQLVGKRPHSRGLHTTEIDRIARHFGASFKRQRVVTNEDATGLLVLERGRRPKREFHIAALFQGVVINPADGLVWDFDTFLVRGEWKAKAILERVE